MCTQVATIAAQMGLLRDIQRDYRKIDDRVKNIELALARGPDAEVERRLAAIENHITSSNAKSGVWVMLGGQAWTIIVSILTSGAVVAAALEWARRGSN